VPVSTQKGSAGSSQNYSRLLTTFDPGSTTVIDRAPFVATEVFDKVAVLSGLALVAGVGTAVAKPAPGIMILAFLVAIGSGIGGIFAPTKARILAPVYAVAMGAVLGWISRLYSSGNGDVVPLAILGTTAIFLCVLGAYRTGLVRVTHRFMQVALTSAIGLLVMMLAVIFGLQLPHTSQSMTYLIVFGVLYLVVAVMGLFVDFNYVYMAQRAGVSKDGEWFAALSIMFSVVMIYLALLRILGSRR
jgi:uncharacterized YccA/Bax inhibitor family protein